MGVVVVGVDLSSTSTVALHEAIQEAVWRNCSVHVLYVLTMPAYTAFEPGAIRFDLDTMQHAAEAVLEEHLATIEAGYVDGFPVDVVSDVVIGHTGTQILRAATEHDAELVVLGSRGLGGFRGLMVGSVTTYAVHHLECRLLVVPAEQEDKEDK